MRRALRRERRARATKMPRMRLRVITMSVSSTVSPSPASNVDSESRASEGSKSVIGYTFQWDGDSGEVCTSRRCLRRRLTCVVLEGSGYEYVAVRQPPLAQNGENWPVSPQLGE